MMTENPQKIAATAEQEIIDTVIKQRTFFKTGATKSYQSRIENLNKLKTDMKCEIAGCDIVTAGEHQGIGPLRLLRRNVDRTV